MQRDRSIIPSRGRTTLSLCALLISLHSALSTPVPDKEHVILLHGLCRTSRSMIPMDRALAAAGYQVHNVDYPSRAGSTEPLSEDVIGEAVAECQRANAQTIHFVAHSFGAILVRSYLARHILTNVGHVVMLGPPNQGSEVGDKLGRLKLFLQAMHSSSETKLPSVKRSVF